MTARGEKKADLLLTNARILDVYSGKIISGNLAVGGGRILGIGDYSAERVEDLGGRYLSPGFIDAHFHIESSMLSVSEYARAVVASGTVAVVADPHEIANVLGVEGLRYMLDSADGQLVSVYWMLPSCVPSTDMETSGARLGPADLAPFLNDPRVVGLGEMMNYPGVIRKDRDALEKIEAARKARKPVDGHSPGLTGPDLDTYIAAGIGSDHECTRLEEAREKLEKGMQIMIREGTAARNLDALLPIANRYTASRLMWCTDDRHPKDLLEGGHIDGMIRRAIRSGLDPLSAIRMATLTPATYFGISALGAISPGKRADLVVFRDLSAPVIETVYRSGIRAAENGRVLPGAERPAAKAAPNTMRIDPSRIDFSIPAAGNRIRVIDLVPDQIVTRQSVHPPHVRNGEAVSDITRDILKIVVVERHTGSGRTGYGFVRGFGLRKGALASSVAHDSHNLIIVGVSDADMAAAARGVIAAGGGLAAASEGRILADLPLPIAGLMSHDPLPEVCSKMERLLGAARELGSPLPEPFMPLSFLSLPVIPELKLTDHGLVDVEKFRIVPLFTAD